MSAEEVFTVKVPDLNKMIKDLEALDKRSNEAIRRGINKGADIILEEQKRLIRGKSKRLAEALKKSDINVSKKTGRVSVSTGYQEDSFNTAMGDNYWKKESVGIVGLVHEFGRPGESQGRTGGTMKQRRRGKLVTVDKGIIVPTPHIRRGFDNKIEQAAQAAEQELEKAINEVLEK